MPFSVKLSISFDTHSTSIMQVSGETLSIVGDVKEEKGLTVLSKRLKESLSGLKG